jgi:hypothetical protein
MTATFISKQQLNDIDACMAHMEQMDATLRSFNSETPLSTSRPGFISFTLVPDLRVVVEWDRTPHSAIQQGKQQAQAWRINSSPAVFNAINDQLEPIRRFVNYLIAEVDRMPPFELVRVTASLSTIVLPRDQLPAGVAPGAWDYSRLMAHHQISLARLSYSIEESSPRYDAHRVGIYQSLPRVVDYMTVRLVPYNTRSREYGPHNTAFSRRRSTQRHYALGMMASANFHTQYRRIMELLSQASGRYSQLLYSNTLPMLTLSLRLLLVELTQVQQFCREMAALRTGR